MKQINLNELRDRVYQIAVAHGWHEKKHSREHCMCLVMTELCEAVEADRKRKRAEKMAFDNWQMDFRCRDEDNRIRCFISDFERYIKDSLEDEIADAIIRLLDYAGDEKINLCEAGRFDYVLSQLKPHYSSMRFTESVFFIIRDLGGNRVVDYIAKIVALAESVGIKDIFWFVEQKMKYNEHRPYKHGKRY